VDHLSTTTVPPTRSLNVAGAGGKRSAPISCSEDSLRFAESDERDEHDEQQKRQSKNRIQGATAEIGNTLQEGSMVE